MSAGAAELEKLASVRELSIVEKERLDLRRDLRPSLRVVLKLKPPFKC